MNKVRIIPRLDIKNDTVVKGIQFEGIRVVGDPEELARRYYENGADELLYIDAVASLYDRNSLTELIKKAVRHIFIPITVGGGVRKLDDITEILHSGADKVAINTAGVRNPGFLAKAVRKFGSQCIVLSVQAKKQPTGHWEAYMETGRERSGCDVAEWIVEAQNLGVGEILLTSVDTDGTKKGMDLELARAMAPLCRVPLIFGGGVGEPAHLAACLEACREDEGAVIDGLAVGSGLHYGLFGLDEAKKAISEQGFEVRWGA